VDQVLLDIMNTRGKHPMIIKSTISTQTPEENFNDAQKLRKEIDELKQQIQHQKKLLSEKDAKMAKVSI
jgi:hypothetical protein